MREIYVSKIGTADYTSIQDAIDSVRVFPLEEVTIYIASGIYEEKLTIPENKPTIQMIGEDENQTIITFADFAEKKDQHGNKLGTFRTATATIYADDFTLKNVIIRNTAGFGNEIGQAVALYVAGDRCMFNHVTLLGNQDTLYTNKGRHLFNNCYIEGHVDYIFGGSTAIFSNCQIHSLRAGYITAASTPKDQSYGFVFLNCKLTSVAKQHSVYLGRPWRPYAHTYFINCWLDEHIIPAGWNNWRNPDNEHTARYAEYHSTGPGAELSQRVNWAKQLQSGDVESLTIDRIFTYESNQWQPSEE